MVNAGPQGQLYSLTPEDAGQALRVQVDVYGDDQSSSTARTEDASTASWAAISAPERSPGLPPH